MKLIKSPVVLGLIQATGLVVYTAVMGAIMLNGNHWFGSKPGILGPMLFLSLFVFSAVVSAAVMVGYPFYLFWEKKNFKMAFEVVLFSALWLLVFIIVIALILLLSR